MKWIPILMALLLLSGCGATQKTPGYRQVGMEEAMAMMKTESDYVILDVRRPDEFAEKHIPGAVNVPNETIGSAEIPELPDKDQLILVYCRSGNRSKKAARILVENGYEVMELGSGFNGWASSGRDIER